MLSGCPRDHFLNVFRRETAREGYLLFRASIMLPVWEVYISDLSTEIVLKLHERGLGANQIVRRQGILTTLFSNRLTFRQFLTRRFGLHLDASFPGSQRAAVQHSTAQNYVWRQTD